MKTYVIGRGLDSDIVINDDKDLVSRHHAVISISFFGKMSIADTSQNGVFVNNERINKGVKVIVSRKDKISLAQSWDFDWQMIKDPYKNLRVALLCLCVFFVAGIGCSAYFFWDTIFQDHEKSNPVGAQPESIQKSVQNVDSISKSDNAVNTASLKSEPSGNQVNAKGSHKKKSHASHHVESKKNTSKDRIVRPKANYSEPEKSDGAREGKMVY